MDIDLAIIGAGAAGLPVRRLDDLLLILIAVTIVVSLQAVGIVLVVAMITTPAATAQLLLDAGSDHVFGDFVAQPFRLVDAVRDDLLDRAIDIAGRVEEFADHCYVVPVF